MVPARVSVLEYGLYTSRNTRTVDGAEIILQREKNMFRAFLCHTVPYLISEKVGLLVAHFDVHNLKNIKTVKFVDPLKKIQQCLRHFNIFYFFRA